MFYHFYIKLFYFLPGAISYIPQPGMWSVYKLNPENLLFHFL